MLYTRAARQRIALQREAALARAEAAAAVRRLQTRYEQEHAARLAAEDALVTAREDARIANERALRAETALHALNTVSSTSQPIISHADSRSTNQLGMTPTTNATPTVPSTNQGTTVRGNHNGANQNTITPSTNATPPAPPTNLPADIQAAVTSAIQGEPWTEPPTRATEPTHRCFAIRENVNKRKSVWKKKRDVSQQKGDRVREAVADYWYHYCGWWQAYWHRDRWLAHHYPQQHGAGANGGVLVQQPMVLPPTQQLVQQPTLPTREEIGEGEGDQDVEMDG